MHLLRDGVESLHQSAHRLSESPARVLDILLNISIVECPYRIGVRNGFRLCYMRHVGKRSGRTGKEYRKAAVSNPLLIGFPDGIGICRGGAKVSIFIEIPDRSALILERQESPIECCVNARGTLFWMI